MLAKIAADVNKPNGQFRVPEDRVQWIEKMSIRKICGIGKVTQRMLNKLGIQTIEEVWQNRGLIQGCMTAGISQFLLLASRALPHVREEKPRQSISHNRTFRDCSDLKVLQSRIRDAAGSVAEELRG